MLVPAYETVKVHTHDCEDCIFVGGDGPQPGEPRVNQVDMYVHLHAKPFGTTLIRRYSSDGPEYASMPVGMGAERIEKYSRVAYAARAMGLKV